MLLVQQEAFNFITHLGQSAEPIAADQARALVPKPGQEAKQIVTKEEDEAAQLMLKKQQEEKPGPQKLRAERIANPTFARDFFTFQKACASWGKTMSMVNPKFWSRRCLGGYTDVILPEIGPRFGFDGPAIVAAGQKARVLLGLPATPDGFVLNHHKIQLHQLEQRLLHQNRIQRLKVNAALGT
jgi:hypothetical protein